MAQQQQNITITAPGFQGINTEDSPLDQDPEFCSVSKNAVVDSFGRVGARKAWAEYTTAINVTYSAAVGVARTEQIVDRIGQGVVNGVRTVLCSVAVFQYDSSDVLLQEDYFICELNTPLPEVYELDEIALPVLTTPSRLRDCQFIAFNDRLYIFSRGNECMVYDGTTLSLLFSGTIDVDYIPPTDDTGVIASVIDGDVATAAYGRLWVTGVDGDYETIFYSDLLLGNQWFDGRASPVDSQNTGGIINVSQYWPSGRDRIVGMRAHNNFLYVFGRQSVLVYTGMAADPAALDGATLFDTVENIGLVNRDAVVNIGSDIIFLDDTGVRSMGRTIQEKSVPIGDLTFNVRTDISQQIADTDDKSTISMGYWPNESLAMVLFSDDQLAYVMELRAPSTTGGMKMTKWTGCRFNRSLYYESDDQVNVFLCANQDNKGLLEYRDYLQYDAQAYDFEYVSNQLTFGQPAVDKFIKQIDYTIVAANAPADGFATWGASSRSTPYSKTFTVRAAQPALFGVAQFTDPADGTSDEAVAAFFGPGLSTTARYRVNAKGRGEDVQIGLRVEIAGNACSLQELNIQTLIGRMN